MMPSYDTAAAAAMLAGLVTTPSSDEPPEPLTEAAPEVAEASGRARLLDGGHAGYLVRGDQADLFAVRRGLAGGGTSRRHFVARLPVGALVPSSTAIGRWRLLLVPLPGGRLDGLPEERLRIVEDGLRDAEPGTADPANVLAAAVADGLDAALLVMADALRADQAPRDAGAMRPAQISSLAATGTMVGSGGVCWLRTVGGQVRRNGSADETFGGRELMLLAGRDWIAAEADVTLESQTTVDVLRSGELWRAVDQHVARLLRVVEQRIDEDAGAHLRSIEHRKRVNAAVLASAARQSLGVLGRGTAARDAAPTAAGELDLYRRAAAVLTLLLEATGHPVVEPADRSRTPASEVDAVRAVARSSGLNLRDLRLPPGWWRQDLGPLIGWHGRGTDGATVVAVPLLFRRGRYRRVDPETRAAAVVDAAAARAYGESAAQLQVPLPLGAGMRRLLRHGLTGAGRDGLGLLLAGFLFAVLSLAAPLVIGHVLGSISTDGQPSGLLAVSALFVVSAVVAAGVGTIQNLRLLRFEGRAETGTQLALWDRVMRLPARFFTGTTSGELTNTVLGILVIREALSGLLSQIIVAGLTVVAVLGMLLWIDTAVALCALVVVVVTLAVALGMGTVVVRRTRVALPAEHRTAALTNQLLSGITKIKLAGAEDRAYSLWAQVNAAARLRLQRVRNVQAVLMAVCSTLPIAGQLVLFLLLAGPGAGRVGVAEFFVVNVVFALLAGSQVVLLSSMVEVFAMLPRLENLTEVLDAEPEHRPERADPGELRGEVELSSVTFAYQPDAPPVLDGVSLRVRPGEFVAIVGPSGCGKSTLLRLLLGFERPTTGAVLFDGQDLADLDLQAVRRQCGVVLQDGQLFAGTIRENICGAGHYRLDQVWDAARMSGLEADISQLPMGMGTLLSFGGGTLSVGQRQRILIARALVARPRILMFDEATSALDNRTQDIVTASTQELAASRIVIAHRLSTVANADRILVLDAGRVVQEGTYRALMRDRAGLFHRLASRQLVSTEPTDPA